MGNCLEDFFDFFGGKFFGDQAMGQNLRYLFGVGYPPKVVLKKKKWDVHRGTGLLTHSHIPGASKGCCLLGFE